MLPPRHIPGIVALNGPSPLTSLLLQPSDTASASDAPADAAHRRPRTPAPGSRASRSTKPGSSFTALTRTVHEMGLMRRRYGYYWAKLIGAVVLLGRLGGGLHMDRRLLVATGQRRSLGCRHDPDRLSRPRRRTSADVQVRPLERLGQHDHREPPGGNQLRLVAEQAHPPPREPQQRGRRPRHRPTGRLR